MNFLGLAKPKNVGILTLVILMAACSSGGTSNSSGGTSNSSGGTSKQLRFESLIELRDAYIIAGGSCSEWKQENLVSLALESGNCNDRNVLSIYSSHEVAVEMNRSTKKFTIDLYASLKTEPPPPHILAGDNWDINDSDIGVLNKLKEKFGGELITNWNQIP